MIRLPRNPASGGDGLAKQQCPQSKPEKPPFAAGGDSFSRRSHLVIPSLPCAVTLPLRQRFALAVGN
jgi:hypothetical protein